MRDLPEWLEEFTDNPEDTELQETYFPEDRNCEVCLRTKMTRAPCRRRNGGAVPRAEKCGGLVAADYKVEGESRNKPVRCRCSRSCHSMDSILSVQNKDPAGDGHEFTKVHRSVAKTEKLFVRTIHWNLENLVKIYRGIIELQHLIDPKRMALLKERCAE